ncbi:MAG: hypothetical protein R3272_11800 [Candidatus Promineifilaceae bacterium]|nr:hypothetical protein [Candidatus Promineifilaceae bacterium]
MSRESDPPPTDISPQARSIARLVDRLCRTPGRYLIIYDVPGRPDRERQVEIWRAEILRRMSLKKEGDEGGR